MSKYDTQFSGEFRLNKELSPELHEYLKYFSAKKRVKWGNLPEEFGTDGEYYYEGMTDTVSEYMFGKKVSGCSPVRVASVKCPYTQPNNWCNWIPSNDGTKIVWNTRKNFNDYVAWLRYIICNFLASRGYILNGKVFYCGDCTMDYIHPEIEEGDNDDAYTVDSADDDFGYIIVEDNIVNYTGPIGLWGEHFIEFVDDDADEYNNMWGWSIIFAAPLGVVACGIYVYYLLYGTVNN